MNHKNPVTFTLETKLAFLQTYLPFSRGSTRPQGKGRGMRAPFGHEEPAARTFPRDVPASKRASARQTWFRSVGRRRMGQVEEAV